MALLSLDILWIIGFLLSTLVLLVAYVKLNDSRLGAIPTSALYFSPKRVTADDVYDVDVRMRAREEEEARVRSEERKPGKKELVNDADIQGNEGESVVKVKTGRRYIVVGGGGFLGGWIVTKLLQRGEDPHNIRILDINPPINHVPRDAISQGLQFMKTDVTKADALEEAFLAPWPSNAASSGPLTVFHTAANIRFYERSERFYSRSTAVNVVGTQNVINASLKAGADVLVYTSSGSVGVKSGCYLTAPWQTEVGDHFVQVVDDSFDAADQTSGFGIANDDSSSNGARNTRYGVLDKTKIRPKGRTNRAHSDFFSNYARSKLTAERLVRDANKSPTGSPASQEKRRFLHTGCIRPGNGVYGPRGDILCGAYLARGTNPTWIPNVVQSFIYVENAAEAHLCYEKRLIEASDIESLGLKHSRYATLGSKIDESDREKVLEVLEKQRPSKRMPDVSGQAFCVADPGAPPTFGDVYVALETLSEGVCHFPLMSATFMLFIAYLFEAWYTVQQILASTFQAASQNTHLSSPIRYVASKLLHVTQYFALSSTLVNLQPPLFSLTSAHLVFDDSRARLPPSKGGLGYKGRYNTMEGLWKTWEEWDRDKRKEAERAAQRARLGTGDDLASELNAKSSTAGVSMSFGWFGGGAKKKPQMRGVKASRAVQAGVGVAKVVAAATGENKENIPVAPVEVAKAQ
ncbi:hypothetical protein CVT24_003200 [Panaeolus cyanescens]|uniref:3-beta hydroxysteroid dehydrogenase/isomerase domain-containing protein n=1 Tax=Panaeolus cyanescens TaxID=181874 RepID=A0A409W8D7_9AGAR|nr:hypothetical protein CVT24_003200 [Panaeolus cyanescens]